MNLASIVASMILATVLTMAASAAEGPAPSGWILTGSNPTAYQVGTAPQGGQSRGPAGFIRSKQDSISGFGTLMQTINAADYRGRRVRFSALVRSENVANWAGLWMRVDGPPNADGKPKLLAFDNMMKRPITATTGWTRHDVVLDVPVAAEKIAFGILLNGTGAAWLDGVSLDAVSDAVPVTARTPEESQLPNAPKNLNFSG
jgi:hypothetical protein